MAYDLGDLVPLTVTITDADGNATNASTVTLTITLPDGATATPTVTNPPATTGVYLLDYAPAQPGRHVARWTSSGPQAAYVDVFDVRPASPGYIVSLADAKAQLNMTSAADDEELRFYIEAVTAVVEDILGRAVVRRSFTEEHSAYGEFMLNWTPVVSLETVATVDGSTTWDVADLRVSTSGVVSAKGGAALIGDIVATYVAGPTIVPANWSLAARLIIQQIWDTQRGTQGGGVHPGGLDTPGAGFTRYGFLIPARAQALLTGGLAGV